MSDPGAKLSEKEQYEKEKAEWYDDIMYRTGKPPTTPFVQEKKLVLYLKPKKPEEKAQEVNEQINKAATQIENLSVGDNVDQMANEEDELYT